ncbi:hypothetical protein ONS96_002757 [Cadophora gregata f. sp. sojae]|nr:hypothetical protein ONS96_002757 [Cadophora gregata f. sp. sojae]
MQIGNLELLIQNASRTDNPQPVEEPKDQDVRWRASYSIDPTYRSTMDEWARSFDTTPPQKQTLEMSEGRDFRWQNYGHKEITGGASVSSYGLFRLGAQHNQSEKFDKVTTEYSSSDIEITITWKAMRLFNVSPGIWDIPDIYSKYPTLKADAVPPNRDLIRPTQLLCASGLGATIKFSDQARKSMDEHITKASSTSGSGGVRLGFLGFKAKAKGGVSSTSTTDVHEFTWKSEVGELIIEPTPNYGSAQLLAVVGQRLATA